MPVAIVWIVAEQVVTLPVQGWRLSWRDYRLPPAQSIF
jgi:hypothetical protein